MVWLTSWWMLLNEVVRLAESELHPPVDGDAEVAPVLPKDCMLAVLEMECIGFVIFN